MGGKVGTGIHGIKAMVAETALIKRDTEATLYELKHVSRVFPDNTVKTCVLTAGAVADTYGAWAVIMDNLGVTLGDAPSGTGEMHITAMLLEDISTISERCMVQLAYGDSRFILNVLRFQGGNQVKLPAVGIERFRPLSSPIGEILYYRMMAETALTTAEVHFRWHLHNSG